MSAELLGGLLVILRGIWTLAGAVAAVACWRCWREARGDQRRRKAARGTAYARLARVHTLLFGTFAWIMAVITLIGLLALAAPPPGDLGRGLLISTIVVGGELALVGVLIYVRAELRAVRRALAHPTLAAAAKVPT